MTTTLNADDPHMVLINTFTVAPEKADALIALLDEATEQVMRHLPGFISANLHRAADGSRVANYAQWRSRADFDAMLTNPAAQVHMRQAAVLADSFDPQIYTLRHTFGREAAA